MKITYISHLLLHLGFLASLSIEAIATEDNTNKKNATSGVEQRPNILFIFTDDHALSAISAYGGYLKNIAKTPNIDRLAKEGALFQQSFCTNSICGPSRASILTGKHSHMNGFRKNGDHFNGDQWTFNKALQEAGYSTALIGKWHLHGKPQGFDYWEILPGQGNYYNPDFIQMDGSRRRITGYSTDIITEKAITWLKNRPKNKPFLLMCQHKAPHRTFAPALRHLGYLKNKTIPEPNNLFDNYASRNTGMAKNKMSIAKDLRWNYDLKVRREERQNITLPSHCPDGSAIEYQRMKAEQKKQWNAHYAPLNATFIADFKAGKYKNQKKLTRWKYQRYLKNYLATIQSVDESVGKLLNYLDTNNLANNTIVIYSSDQGFYLGEHGWYDKRWMYEESFKMPFIIRWTAKITPNTRSKALIQNIDYAPTFLEAAGLTIPKEIQGRSLMPIFKAKNSTPKHWRRSLYYHYWMHGSEHQVPEHYGIRTETHKLIHYPRSKEWELFNLQTDPQEMLNLYLNPQFKKERKQLKEELKQLRQYYKVPQC